MAKVLHTVESVPFYVDTTVTQPLSHSNREHLESYDRWVVGFRF
jgi:hypothetical protein